MTQASHVVLSLIAGLLAVIVGAIDATIGVLRSALAQIGLHGPPQTALLVILAILLIVSALRLFGRVFAVLIALFLLLLVLQMLVPGVLQAAGHRVRQP